MENSLKYGLAAAIFGMGTKMITFSAGWDYSVSTQLYFLFLLLGIYFAIRDKVRSEGIMLPFKTLLVSGLQAGAVFTVLTSAYTYFFHRWVDVSYFGNLIAARVSEAQKIGYSEEEMEKLVSNAEFIFSPATHSTVTLLGFMLAALVYSLIWAALIRKFPALIRY
jgi:hypothetical protein